MSTPFRLKGSGPLVKDSPHTLGSDTSRLRSDVSSSVKRVAPVRHQPHALLATPQHLAASVRSPQVSVSLDSEGYCKQMRLAARWQDIHSIVEQHAALSPSATAFALHRLGCFFVYLSWQRRAELERSKLVDQLIEVAAQRVRSFGAAEVSLALDGIARLRCQPPTVLLDALAQQALVHAQDLTPSQAPVILWAFAMLRYNPVVAVLSALDRQIERQASQITAQGVTLVLSSYQAWRYHPEGGSLRALASNMRQRLASFKNSELATAIEAFSALGFHPGNDLVQAIAVRAGAAVSPATLAQPVVNHRALDAVSAEARKAAALSASSQSEVVTAKEFGAAVSKSGRAAAATLEQTAQDAQTRLQEAGQGLLQAPEGSGRMVQDWLYEFGQWNEGRTPSLCPAVAVPHDLPSSRWCFSSSSQTRYPS